MGKTKVIAETGAGQHGVGTGAALFDMECTVFMGAEDIERDRSLMCSEWKKYLEQRFSL